jgi:hypothetical protein
MIPDGGARLRLTAAGAEWARPWDCRQAVCHRRRDEVPVTTYALHQDATSVSVLAVWSTAVGHRAATVSRLRSDLPEQQSSDLCAALTHLSSQLWDTYTDPPSGHEDPDAMALLAEERGDGLHRIREAVQRPHLPDGQGVLLVSYDPLVEAGHAVGRALHGLGDAGLAQAVAAEVAAEIDAVDRAGRGDLSGRAVQAVALDHLDASPVQIVAADGLLREAPLGDRYIVAAVDPAAACVAAAHWLVAAAEVAAEVAGCDPAAVFTYADDLEAVSVEVPSTVVQAVVEEEQSPRQIVTDLLGDAMAVARGRVPDPAGLPDLVDAARDQVARLRPGEQDEALAGLLERLTVLDPRQASRDLLEHLCDGLRSCLLVYRDAIDDDGPAADDDADEPDDEAVAAMAARVVAQFVDAVRQRAARDHDRLSR